MGDDDVRRPMFSCRGPGRVATPVVAGQVLRRRRWRDDAGSSAAERGESSSSISRKRARLSLPLPIHPLLSCSDDDFHRFINDGIPVGRGDDDDDDFAVVAGGGVDDEQPPPPPAQGEADSNDDEWPVPLVSRARPLVRRGSSTSTSTAPAPAPAPPAAPAPAPAPPEPSLPPPPPSSDTSSGSVMRNVTVENSAVFDCTICYLPLRSPIFQCGVGHVVCAPCNDKLAPATRCHVCRAPTPGGYARCIAMEQVVDAIRVPCPHAAHGCSEVSLAHHDRDAHAGTCAHRPCRCPVEGCGFAGSVLAALPAHLAAAHGWPCTAGSITGADGFDVRLRKGFNVVAVTTAGGGGAATTAEERYTFVLNVERPAPVCDAVTAFCIDPTGAGGTVRLGLSYYRRWRADSGGLVSKYLQSSQLDVVCTDLADGMPGPSSCCPFLVPTWSAVAPGGEDGDDDISVTINYIRAT